MDDFIKRLRETFDLREDGLLVWRKPTSNRAKVGDVAGSSKGTRQHQIQFLGRVWTARSLAFAHREGKLPAGFIDEDTGIEVERKREAGEPLESLVRRMLNYDPDTGRFSWAMRPAKGRRMVDQVGVAGQNRYLRVKLGGKALSLHRVAWFMVYGKWPEGVIDHINGDRTDNRIANLRDVTCAVNTQNQRRAMATNRLGVLGVGPCGKAGFRATIKVDGKGIHLGSFKTPEEAHQRYVQAKREFHAGCTL